MVGQVTEVDLSLKRGLFLWIVLKLLVKVNCSCPANCAYCFSGSICSECKTGYYGDQCSYRCSIGCSINVCNQQNGRCTYGCNTDYYGDLCCPEGYSELNCSKKCEHINCFSCSTETVCTSCKKGYYGKNCSLQCSPGCGLSICTIETAECTYGCTSGYDGPRCCQNGLYGSNCSLECPRRCSKCLSESECTECEVGYFGKLCSNLCSDGCFLGMCDLETGDCGFCNDGLYGEKCSKQCNNCRYNLCNQKTGACTYGCALGYSEPYCCSNGKTGSTCSEDGTVKPSSHPGITDSPTSTETDPSLLAETDSPHQEKTNPSPSGSSSTSNVALIAGLVAGAVFLVAVIVGAVCLIKHRQKKFRDRNKSTEMAVSPVIDGIAERSARDISAPYILPEPLAESIYREIGSGTESNSSENYIMPADGQSTNPHILPEPLAESVYHEIGSEMGSNSSENYLMPADEQSTGMIHMPADGQSTGDVTADDTYSESYVDVS